MGFEMFNEVDPEYYGREAAKQAYTMLYAKNCPAGRMTVAIDNGFGGVIFNKNIFLSLITFIIYI